MCGRYTRLDPLGTQHAQALFEAFALAPDERAFTYLFDERPDSLLAMQAKAERLNAATDAQHYAVIDTLTERAVGHAALMRIDRTHGVIEVGHITMSPLLQRTRTATEMMWLLMTHVFDELGYLSLIHISEPTRPY